MPHPLISHNADLKQLFDEGHAIDIKHGYLFIYDVPYLNSQGNIKTGVLVSTLCCSADTVNRPDTHVINFIGEFPCNKDGTKINGIEHSGEQDLGNGIKINFSFSNKPKEGYANYYDKATQYIRIISAPAKSLDNSVTEKTHQVIEQVDEQSVFKYHDSNSSRAEINAVTMKLAKQKIAIIGLGGTGSYILDLISKTPVQEIHLYDGDTFLQHNAFRAPGAAILERINEKLKKTDYWKQIYSEMHLNIISHNEYISERNFEELLEMDFIFVCLDSNDIKRQLIDFFEKKDLQFIDVGMGIQKTKDNMLTGILRVTSGTKNKRDHIRNRITLNESSGNEYDTNIQIADLNALNAALAVIKWKKHLGFYADFEKENNTSYSIDTNFLKSDDIDS